MENESDSKILDFLKNLGKPPKNFNGNILVEYVHHKNKKIRLLSVKNLGKLKDINYLKVLTDVFENEPDSKIKREIVSALGRMKSKETIPVLLEIIKNEDPKIICQAVRGLVFFKGLKEVDDSLKELLNHPNETIKTFIHKEYFYEESATSNFSNSSACEKIKNLVVHGDSLEVMKSIDNELVHLTFTSPPYYNAKDYSIYTSYESYLDFLESIFKEVHRLTKEGRFLVVNTSPIIIPRISRSHSSKRYAIPFDLHSRLTKIGWEFIDDIIWLKPEASVKNRNGGFSRHRKPLGYKPNAITEYLMVYRKESEKLIDWNMEQYEEQIIEDSKIIGDYETSNVWKISPRFDKNHPAVFPEDLCKRIIEFYSFKNDLVFDPFAGSGTTGKIAERLGRFFLLVEKDLNYFEHLKKQFSNCFSFEEFYECNNK